MSKIEIEEKIDEMAEKILTTKTREDGTFKFETSVGEFKELISQSYKEGQAAEREKAAKLIKANRYNHDNYKLMMSSRKNYDRGILAREICDNILDDLLQTEGER